MRSKMNIRHITATLLRSVKNIEHSKTKLLPTELRSDCYILVNGNIITMDAIDSHVQAIAVENGQIVQVGYNRDMKKFIRRGWKEYDLTGKTLLPGFIDCHSHLDLTGITYVGLQCTNLHTLNDIIRELAEKAAKSPRGKLIIMFGFNEMELQEQRVPDRYDLDRATIHHPVVLVHYTWHQSYLNSYAINYFGITRESIGVDIVDEIVNGILRDPISVDVNSKVVKSFTEKEIKNGIIKAANSALEHGITTIHTMQGNMGLNSEDWMKDLQLPIHVVIWEQSNDVEKVLKKRLTRIGGCGAMQADGEIGSDTAALFEAYSNQIENYGVLNYSQEYWNQLIMNAHKNHLQFAAHAEGEAGIEAVLYAIEKAQKEYVRPDSRHRIEHLELPTLNQLDRMAKAGIIASIQPAFVNMSSEEMNSLYQSYGKTRMKRLNPFRIIHDAGILMSGGSDSPVTPYDPLLGIHWAVNHPLAEQRLSLREALELFTVNAAYSGFEEKEKGTLEKGKLADMVVLNKDPYIVPLNNLYELIKVEAVFVAGKCKKR